MVTIDRKRYRLEADPSAAKAQYHQPMAQRVTKQVLCLEMEAILTIRTPPPERAGKR